MAGIEVELRFKVTDTQKVVDALRAQGITIAKHQHIIDQWFCPTHVKSLAQEEQWFDHDHGVAWRIRRVEQPDGSFAVMVDSKQLTEDNNHDTFTEHTTDIHDYQEGLAMITKLDYRNWLTIDKTRTFFESGRPDMEIVLDEVAGLAAKIGVEKALEVEFKGQGTRAQALEQLHTFAQNIGFDPTKDRFDRSLTVEAMKALANFDA